MSQLQSGALDQINCPELSEQDIGLMDLIRSLFMQNLSEKDKNCRVLLLWIPAHCGIQSWVGFYVTVM